MPAGLLLLVHWHAAEAEALASPLRAGGWTVAIEAEDGGRAVRTAKDDRLDAVLISLGLLPSHGRATAGALAKPASTRTVPLVFLGGSGEVLERLRVGFPAASFVASPADLPAALAALKSRPPETLRPSS